MANKAAMAAHDGLALAVRPAHTPHDGDTFFALATGTYTGKLFPDRLMAATVLCVSRAIVRAVEQADGLGGVPSVRETKSV
jgi:L-aminopeptidase/D-esterase-like protein